MMLISDMLLPLGGLAGLMACGCLTGSQQLSDCLALLTSHASSHGYVDRWMEGASRDALLLVLIGLGAVIERLRMDLAACDTVPVDHHLAIRVAPFAVASAALVALGCTILHICRCLLDMVDNFCCRFVENADFTEAVREWNLLQAVLRLACGTVQYAFAMLQFTAMAAVMCTVADASRVKGHEWLLAPGLLMVLAIVRVFLGAAAVTDKCARVPAFINSLSVGKDLDMDRMYVVEYILHSQAGFYFFEVRLDSVLALKLFYFSCVVAFGIATKVLSP